jgi:hypothetical protein
MKRIDFGNTEIECDKSQRYQILQSISSRSDRKRMRMTPCIQAYSYEIHYLLTMINKRPAHGRRMHVQHVAGISDIGRDRS